MTVGNPICDNHCVLCWKGLFIYSCVYSFFLIGCLSNSWIFRWIHLSIPLQFTKLLWALDQHKFKSPKIETWSHRFHWSWPPSSSKPAPHTVSITWTLRITLWHKTRVCPFHDWAHTARCRLSTNMLQLQYIWEVSKCCSGRTEFV